jgi:formylglycine-generating enzyme required for sulfatase activity
VPVGSYTKGNAKWSQSDMSGNIWEWTLDFDDPYVTPCNDCADVASTSASRVVRGGSYFDTAPNQVASARQLRAPAGRSNVGPRCARAPH